MGVAGALPAAGVADHHDAVAHQLGLVQLHHLGGPVGPVDEGHVLRDDPLQDGLQLVVLRLVRRQPGARPNQGGWRSTLPRAHCGNLFDAV